MFILTPGCVPAGGAASLSGSPAARSGQVSMHCTVSIKHNVVIAIFLK